MIRKERVELATALFLWKRPSTRPFPELTIHIRDIYHTKYHTIFRNPIK